MQTYYLAVDIGASSGRHILGYLDNGRMILEEIYRFENGMTSQDGKKLWDVQRLFAEIVAGMKKCKEIGKIPVSMSIDTWAVDYVLLDEKNQVLGDTYGYRDSRTTGMDAEVYKAIPEPELYRKTGIQKQIFNTIYQLMAVKQNTPELLEKAKTFLMLPDYFQFLLTGNKVSEYTNGTSTQLVNPFYNQWDESLIKSLGYPSEIFLPLSVPGTIVGNLTEDIQKEMDVNHEVFLAPDSMIQAIKDYCADTDQKVPESVGEIATVIYQSLAECYGRTVHEIGANTHKEYDEIHIIGGGANADYLNQLTANATKKTVYAGPGEATAIGNMMAQMIRDGRFKSLFEARKCVRESFDIKIYEPQL